MHTKIKIYLLHHIYIYILQYYCNTIKFFLTRTSLQNYSTRININYYINHVIIFPTRNNSPITKIWNFISLFFNDDLSHQSKRSITSLKKKKKKKEILDTQVLEGKQACQLFRYLGFRERLCRTSMHRSREESYRLGEPGMPMQWQKSRSWINPPPDQNRCVQQKKSGFTGVHRNPRHITTPRLLSARFIGQA